MTNPADKQQIMQMNNEAQAWLVRLESGHATTDDAKAFKAWCAQSRAHASAFSQARQIWMAMAPAARLVKQEQVREQAGAQRSLFARPTGRRAFMGGAVAASVAYLAFQPPLGLWMSMPERVANWSADYQTGVGEQRSVAVASGVTIQMNTLTRLNVAMLMPDAPDATGVDLLSGEAQIQADTPGSRVMVRAARGEIVAQQALFNVRHTNETVCVTCLKGRVDVMQQANVVTLVPGQQLTYQLGKSSVKAAVNTATVAAWRQRMLVFQHAALSDVVDEVNRYRTGKLILRGETLKQYRVQATFSLDRLDDVIALIRDAYHANVTYLPGGVVLLREMSA